MNSSSNARILLIYSDLGEILQINEPSIVDKLAGKYNLLVHSKKSVDSQYNIKDNYDALKNYKKASKVSIYDIRRA